MTCSPEGGPEAYSESSEAERLEGTSSTSLSMARAKVARTEENER